MSFNFKEIAIDIINLNNLVINTSSATSADNIISFLIDKVEYILTINPTMAVLTNINGVVIGNIPQMPMIFALLFKMYIKKIIG